MEKLLRPYDKEYMRMEMLKHEETFKEQVYELHRLYRIQKTLMKSIESSSRPNGKTITNHQFENYMQNNQNSRRFDLEHPADVDQASESDHGNNNRMLEVINESEIELTLGPTKYMPPRKKKHWTDHNPAITSDSAGPSFSFSSTESSHVNRTNSTSMSTKQDKQFHELGGLLQIADITLGYHHHHYHQNGGKNNNNNNIDLEEQLSRQERLKQPPWLYQVLSMNMT